MSVPQGSPRQSTGMSGKGGPSRPSPGGMGGKGGGGPQGMGGPTVGQMNQAINQPMQPSMFSAASSMFGNQNPNNAGGLTQPSMTSSEPQYVNYGNAAGGMQNAGSIDRTGTLTSLPYMGSSNAGLQPSLYRRDLLGESQAPSAQPMGQMLPRPQTLTPIPGFQPQQAIAPPSLQTQVSNFNPRPSVPTPTPRQTIPQGGVPNIPQGLMRRLQSFRGF